LKGVEIVSYKVKKLINKSTTERVKKLREKLLSTRIEIDIERAMLITEFWKKSENLPLIIRKAKALRYILDNMSIYINEGEIIVGNQARKDRAVPIFPEYYVSNIRNELEGNPYYLSDRPVDPYFISEEDTNELKEICKWWEGKTFYDYVVGEYTEEIKKMIKVGLLQESQFDGIGHILINYPRLIRKGLKGIIEEAKGELKSLDTDNSENISKRQFFEAVIICCNAVADFSRRYSELAKKQLEKEKDPIRKEELKKIVEVTEKVPYNPPDTFLEALQSVWFIQLIVQIDDSGHSIGIGRFDQYMYPFYKKDIREGRITEEQIIELIECFIIKISSINKFRDYDAATYNPGYTMFQNLTIGGVAKDGDDATNELSYLVLEAVKNTKLDQPPVSARVSKKTDDEFLVKSAECLNEHRGGIPAFYNDEAIIPALGMTEQSREVNNDYALVGCAELSRNSFSWMPSSGRCFSLLKILELTLNNGRDPMTGMQFFSNQGNRELESFKNFNELYDAYRRQLKHYIKLTCKQIYNLDAMLAAKSPYPLLSSFNSNFKKGRDITDGGADYNGSFILMVGIANVANSLAAIKKLIFTDKIITKGQLRHALNTNFEDKNTTPGGNEIRQILLNRAPKYGNDDDYVDLLAKEVIDYISKVLKSKENKTYRGGNPYLLSLVTVTANVPMGLTIGATSDGRKAKAATNDGCSPTQGTDVKGPTTAISSVTKINHSLIDGGAIYNIKFDPVFFKDPEMLYKFAMTVKTYLRLGGQQQQINIVSNKILREAQKEPEKYRDLIVRVTGYSARFVSLSKIIQDDIIRRTEHQIT